MTEDVQVVLNGHPCVIRESIKWVDVVEQIRRHWNYCENGYPLLIALYAKLIRWDSGNIFFYFIII